MADIFDLDQYLLFLINFDMLYDISRGLYRIL